jgi:hypothetical protein
MWQWLIRLECSSMIGIWSIRPQLHRAWGAWCCNWESTKPEGRWRELIQTKLQLWQEITVHCAHPNWTHHCQSWKEFNKAVHKMHQRNITIHHLAALHHRSTSHLPIDSLGGFVTYFIRERYSGYTIQRFGKSLRRLSLPTSSPPSSSNTSTSIPLLAIFATSASWFIRWIVIIRRRWLFVSCFFRWARCRKIITPWIHRISLQPLKGRWQFVGWRPPGGRGS